jgi:hypothetical protein
MLQLQPDFTNGLPAVPWILILTRLFAVGGSGVISTFASLIAAFDELQLSHVKALQLSAPRSTTARHRLNRADCILQRAVAAERKLKTTRNLQ